MNLVSLTNSEKFVVKNVDYEYITVRECANYKTPLFKFIYVHEGIMDILINLESDSLVQDSLCLIFPNEVLTVKSISHDLKCQILAFSPDEFGEIFARVGFDMMSVMLRHRLFNVKDPAVKKFIVNIFDNVSFIYNLGECELKNQMAISLMKSLLLYGFSRAKAELSNEPKTYNRLEEHFRKFLTLLSAHYKESREVAYYADLLHLTPKYLNYICNMVVKRTCKGFIDAYLIIQLKNELRQTDKTIQEIAYEFNFANQSFLGCYFKKFTGVSPRKFRNGEGDMSAD